MTLRLNIDRLVVDRGLAGALGPLDIGPALETELARLMTGAGSRRGGDAPEGPLLLESEGTFVERLARTLYDGLPALRPARHRKGPDAARVRAHHPGVDARASGAASLPAAASSPTTGPGEPLDQASRTRMERSFRRDLSAVRVHSGREAGLAARALRAEAFASGSHITFAEGLYDPSSEAGAALLAHELAHVVQQSAADSDCIQGAAAELEAQADRASDAVARRTEVPPLSKAPKGVQRRIQMRRVGRGEASGFERLPQLIERLNQISTALIFNVDASGVLGFTENPYGTETEFDRQMRALIADTSTIPLRLTNRHGLMFEDADTFPATVPVEVDDWRSGYVDIDDLLESDDLGLQSALLHFLTERARTSRYAHRMAAEERDAAGVLIQTFPQAEFERVHAQGINAELRLMQDFFGDPGIAVRPGTPGDVLRQFASSRPATGPRRDIIRVHMSPGGGGPDRRGINAVTVDVLLADGRVMSAADYRDLLAREREAAERRRLLELRGGPQGPSQ